MTDKTVKAAFELFHEAKNRKPKSATAAQILDAIRPPRKSAPASNKTRFKASYSKSIDETLKRLELLITQ